jgi:hypothetical protein
MTPNTRQPEGVSTSNIDKKRCGFYLKVEPHHAQLYKVLVLARREDVTQYALFGEMVAHFEQIISVERPVKSWLRAEVGQEQIFIYYFEQDLPQIRLMATENQVRNRALVYAILLQYLEALGVDEAVLNQKLHMFDELTQVSQSLLQPNVGER